MNRTIITLTIIFSIAFYACKKEEVEQPTPINSLSSTQSYINTWTLEKDYFEFQANQGGTFTTQKGSILTIPENAFLNTDNSIATGSIKLAVKEVYTAKEMIKSGTYPISGFFSLNSGGQFFIEATNYNNQLIVRNGKFLSFEIPAQAEDDNMLLFFGGTNENNANWLEADTVDIQQPGDTTNNITQNGFTFNSADSTYSIELDSIGWGNIDAFMSVNYFDCTFNLTGLDDLNNFNTSAFAIFENQNSVWPTGVSPWGSISNNTISETHLADVPMNIIVISVQNGLLYYGLLNITPTQNTTYSIDMIETTPENLDNIIETL